MMGLGKIKLIIIYFKNMFNKKQIIATVAFVAVIAGLGGWFLAKFSIKPIVEKTKCVEQTKAPASQSVQPEPAASVQPTQTQTSTPAPDQSTATSQTSASAQTNQKVGIVFTIKDQSGKILKGITCAVKADEGDHRMIPEVSEKSDSNGICSFKNLDPAYPYLVRVYWTEDKSRVSDVSLSWIPAGTIITRTIVKPANM